MKIKNLFLILQDSFQWLRKIGPLKAALIVFGVLFLFILIVERPSSSSDQRDARYFLPRFTASQATRLTIKSPIPQVASVELQQEPQGWVMNSADGFPVNEDRLNPLLHTLEELSQGAIVSRNPEKHEFYGFKPSETIVLRVETEHSVPDEFYLGSAQEGVQYMKKASSSTVYEVTPSLLPFLPPSLDDWKSLFVLHIDPEKAVRISLKSPKNEWVAERRPAGWFLIQPQEKALSAEQVANLFGRINGLKADSLSGGSLQMPFNPSKPLYKISVRMSDDTLYVVSIGGQDPQGRFYGKNPDRDALYFIGSDALQAAFQLDF